MIVNNCNNMNKKPKVLKKNVVIKDIDRNIIGEIKMEFNNINLFTQNAAALNKAQGTKEAKVEEEAKQPEVKDNKPAEQQYSADEVFNYMAGSAVAAKAKVNNTSAQETRIAGFMNDFEEAFNFAKELGLSDEAALAILERI